jgi:hypothetical protein
MKISQAILDDLGHVTDIVKSDTTPGWMIGAAQMLQTVAEDIRAAAQRERERLAQESKQP